MFTTTTQVWRNLLKDLVTEADYETAPRGFPIRERLCYTTVIPMEFPIVLCPTRKLSYKFLAAEAHWILSGDNRVETIAPYSKLISQFSDDAVYFKGAYGPKVVDQLPYVVEALLEDRQTRRAVMTIWRERPGPSKDIPCTVALQFVIREEKLHIVATMRSSDAWLGWVYDVFNFSMIGWHVLSLYNSMAAEGPPVMPGRVYLTAGSQHLYLDKLNQAGQMLLQEASTAAWSSEFYPIAVSQDWASMLKELVTTPGKVLEWLETAKNVGVINALVGQENAPH